MYEQTFPNKQDKQFNAHVKHKQLFLTVLIPMCLSNSSKIYVTVQHNKFITHNYVQRNMFRP